MARKRVQRAAAALKTKLSFDTAAAAPVSTRTAAGVAAGPPQINCVGIIQHPRNSAGTPGAVGVPPEYGRFGPPRP